MAKLANTTKDVGLLRQLFEDGQLHLSAEFQRNAVWPRPAKAFLIDTILTGNPIPVLYFQRSVSAQTNRTEYTVVDGQQRLNAILQFMDNRFGLTESRPDAPWYRKKWRALNEEEKLQILSYDLVIQELSGYTSSDIRSMFDRMNRYVVPLNLQERRHAQEGGEFKVLVEQVGARPYWLENRIFTKQAVARMRNDEFVAELLILLNEGPQDKKDSVNVYYASFQAQFDPDRVLSTRLDDILDQIQRLIPNLGRSIFRKPANFYALVGALAQLTEQDEQLKDRETEMSRLIEGFESSLSLPEEEQSAQVRQYIDAQSRQTDNIRPRQTRISILISVLSRGSVGA